ncbi:exodeoxyribonuclease VII large subunit [Rickettsiales endosymbiont of Stachyamoeba lipophora]|uniref:exodeoxyribonuclease VII large subunit n=1 Tax=Rickettsiales endosymbiont of Stachyamoeba lipophora TaxID=2486578 RepID=UPI000F64E329|nr:exodeoxyribonuclease VII large subunit [Rickettsiales endosymbiont of Stachyamoeba lipophora]AZL15102.1 exodeoxyribonuclease VII large subunit [Rickettsiales endosymbiont of Stachyamoeba lipophora]
MKLSNDLTNQGSFTNNPELTVTELSNLVKKTIDTSFSYVKVRGEISGLKIAASGHAYFSLKDEGAVLNAICWRAKVNSLGVKLEEGMEIICAGSLTTFPGQSKYQMIVENVTLGGIGALMALLAKRKEALTQEGLFEERHKQPLAKFPQAIGVITSPKGAVIKDILHRIAERFPCDIIVFPVAVQGEDCPGQVIKAIRIANDADKFKLDTLIIARGGGSIEDLWGFNDEGVVRAAFESKIPIISAIGHETDFTLLDFVADKRAPTPTAAAEFATPVKIEIERHLKHLLVNAANIFDSKLYSLENNLVLIAAKLKHPSQIIDELASKIALIKSRIDALCQNKLHSLSQFLTKQSANIGPSLLSNHLWQKQSTLDKVEINIPHYASQYFQKLAHRLEVIESVLKASDYNKILEKGFAIVKDLDGNLISSKSCIVPNKSYEIIFKDGKAKVRGEGDFLLSNPK